MELSSGISGYCEQSPDQIEWLLFSIMSAINSCLSYIPGLKCIVNKRRCVNRRRRLHHRLLAARYPLCYHDSPGHSYRRAPPPFIQTGAVVGRIRNSTLGNLSVNSSCQRGLSTIIRSSSENSLIYQELLLAKSGELSSQCDVQVIITEASESDVDKLEYQKPAYVAVALVMAMTAMAVFFPMLLVAFGMNDASVRGMPYNCNAACQISIVESIPENLTYPEGSPFHVTTYTTWSTLIDMANHSIDVVSFYWTLRGKDIISTSSSAHQGEDILQRLVVAGRDHGIKIRIVENEGSPNSDTIYLEKQGAAMVRYLNMSRFFNGSGILHTKMWLVDRRHLYVGSANMDWRSLTQVKELGLAVFNCDCLGTDALKLFEVYWYISSPGAVIPKYWPSYMHTNITATSPLSVALNGTRSQVYFSSSPPAFCAPQRTVDIAAILDVIDKAQHYVHIAVMNYLAATMFTHPNRFWPDIDNALRKAAINRKIEIRVLGSYWNNTPPDMLRYLKSLADINGAEEGTVDVQVKLFVVPASESQKQIPFARVNHNKYMVTDQVAYVGTSNWSGDYFLSTGGLGLIVNQTDAVITHNATDTVQQQLEEIFQRDWNSEYASPLKNFTRRFSKTG